MTSYRGHDGIRQYFAGNAESSEMFSVDYPDVCDLGDGRVLAIGTLRFRGKASGVETDAPTAMLATYRGGLLAHCKDFGQREKVAEAAGMESG